MSGRFEHQALLDDVLGEDVPGQFREALLEQTLVEVRRKRRGKRWQVGAVVALAAIGLWSVTVKAPPRGYVRHTPPLVVVRTQPLDARLIVRSTVNPALVVPSSAVDVVMVETSLAPQGFLEIDDEQLLAFFTGRPVMLVRQSAAQAELVLLNAEDRDGFQIP